MIVIENIIEKNYQDFIEEQLFSSQFPWNFLNDVTWGNHKVDVKNKTQAFSHVFFDNNQGNSYYYLVLPILLQALSKANLKMLNLIKIRSFLQLSNSNRREHNNPHVDHDFPHYDFLYYVNDADGDTFFFEETTEQIPRNSVTEETKFVVKERFSPKKGTMVVFDGKQYHASSAPTEGKRCVINYNANVIKGSA
jgi:hypothetical protein